MVKIEIPERIRFRKKRYSKYSVHNKKYIAKVEAEKLRMEGHLSTVKSFSRKHVVFIKKKKLVPYPKMKREVYIIRNGQRFDMVTFSWTRKRAKQYAKEQKGTLFQDYRVVKEKTKYGKNKGKRKFVIYGKK